MSSASLSATGVAAYDQHDKDDACGHEQDQGDR
jgi:hypothetical protein